MNGITYNSGEFNNFDRIIEQKNKDACLPIARINLDNGEYLNLQNISTLLGVYFTSQEKGMIKERGNDKNTLIHYEEVWKKTQIISQKQYRNKISIENSVQKLTHLGFLKKQNAKTFNRRSSLFCGRAGKGRNFLEITEDGLELIEEILNYGDTRERLIAQLKKYHAFKAIEHNCKKAGKRFRDWSVAIFGLKIRKKTIQAKNIYLNCEDSQKMVLERNHCASRSDFFAREAKFYQQKQKIAFELAELISQKHETDFGNIYNSIMKDSRFHHFCKIAREKIINISNSYDYEIYNRALKAFIFKYLRFIGEVTLKKATSFYLFNRFLSIYQKKGWTFSFFIALMLGTISPKAEATRAKIEEKQPCYRVIEPVQEKKTINLSCIGDLMKKFTLTRPQENKNHEVKKTIFDRMQERIEREIKSINCFNL